MRHPARLAPPRGFSLVELMVSIVIGMLALVLATRILLVSEQNKDVSLGGSDAMQNGMQALFSVQSDLEQAGFGLNDPIINGCDTIFEDSEKFTLASAMRGATVITPLTAVVIKASATGSDELSVYSGTSPTGTGSLGISTTSKGDATPTVDRTTFGFALNDVVVAANQNADLNLKCVLAQITAEPPTDGSTPTIKLGGVARFNSSKANTATFNANSSRLFNLGRANDLALHTWSAENGFLRLRATELAGASLAPVTVVDNIVAIKAQYGFDTRPTADFSADSGVQRTGMRLSTWSATMIDADGDGVIGDHDDWARVGAVRVAIVARSKNVEKPAPGTACSATPADVTVFTTNEPKDVPAVPITLDLSVAGDTVGWKCYRYRVFETIVSLRNTGWRPTATRPSE